MEEEKIVWHSRTAPDGRELVTFGTPAWPMECYGPWINDPRNVRAVIPWHWHDEMELNLAVNCDVDIMVSGKVWRAKPGQGAFINSGVMHRTEYPTNEGLGYYSIVFNPWIVGGAPGSVFWQKYLTPLMQASECSAVPLLGETPWEKEIAAAMERIVQLWGKKPYGYEFGVREELSRCIVLLSQNCLKGTSAPSAKEQRSAERIKKMLTYVQAHYAEELTTEQIAASAAVSVSECLRCFHSMLGLTPKAYLRQYRVQQAARQLLDTNKSIAEIGEACGFDDMSYFARVFRAEQGLTPSEYRQKGRQPLPLLP